MESKLEQYSKGSKGNRGYVNKESEQTISSAKEKKKKRALRNCHCYPFSAVLANRSLALNFLVLSSDQYWPTTSLSCPFLKIKKKSPYFPKKIS